MEIYYNNGIMEVSSTDISIDFWYDGDISVGTGVINTYDMCALILLAEEYFKEINIGERNGSE